MGDKLEVHAVHGVVQDRGEDRPRRDYEAARLPAEDKELAVRAPARQGPGAAGYIWVIANRVMKLLQKGL